MKATTNGHAALTPGKLAKLLAEREADVAAIHRVQAIMTGDHVATKRARPDILADALALDAKRRAKKTTRRPAPPRGQFAAKIHAQRSASAALLRKAEHADRPLPGNKFGRGLGSLVRRGYLKREGDGYVRTDKPYEV